MTRGNDEVVRGAIVASPFASELGIAAETIEPDHVRLRLPYRPALATIGDLVHGGAIASLVDVAATAAVWSAVDLATSARGTTIGFTINFLTGARGQDLVADARVVQRGRTICVCEVKVTAATPIATALVTYKMG